jgi:hypothetical protein
MNNGEQLCCLGNMPVTNSFHIKTGLRLSFYFRLWMNSERRQHFYL